MKNESNFVKKLAALLKRIKASHPAEPQPQREPVTQMVVGFLEWNATRKSAKDAHARLMAVMVDNNDLRVSHPYEVVAILGERYPLAEERAARLHEALQEIFVREHAIEIDDLATKPKKQVRSYFDTLPGMTPYVAAQVTLLCVAGHAMPVDDHLVELLKGAGVVAPSATVEEASAFLERHVKADDALDVHLSLRAWADSGAAKGKGSGAKAAKASKASKKKTKARKKPAKPRR